MITTDASGDLAVCMHVAANNAWANSAENTTIPDTYSSRNDETEATAFLNTNLMSGNRATKTICAWSDSDANAALSPV